MLEPVVIFFSEIHYQPYSFGISYRMQVGVLK